MGKEERRKETRELFVKAAIQLIEEKGINEVSTRKLAEITGYSYATLYNYFPNMGILFQYCIRDHLLALNEYISTLQLMPLNKDPKTRVIQLSEGVAEYFINHPTAFELIFMVSLTELPPEDIADELLNPSIIMAVREGIIEYTRQLRLPEKEEEPIVQLFLSHMVGKLLYYFRRTVVRKPEKLKVDILNELKILFEGLERRALWMKQN